MVVRIFVGVALVVFGLAACTAKPVAQRQDSELPEATSSAVSWQGYELREVTSLAALPASVRQALGADKPGLEGVAERGKPFNAGDAVVEPLPMRRFIAAGHDGDTWLVAMEEGGIALTVTAVQVSDGTRTVTNCPGR